MGYFINALPPEAVMAALFKVVSPDVAALSSLLGAVMSGTQSAAAAQPGVKAALDKMNATVDHVTCTHPGLAPQMAEFVSQVCVCVCVCVRGSSV